jgi:uncharacterized protein
MTTGFSPLAGIVSRRLLDIALARLEDEPVIALQGPRTVGKSTLLGELARARRAQVVDLDDPAQREAVRTDPGTFVAGPAPVCIDEYQHVPEVLDAIKAELNRDLRPGRFVITGSTRYDALPLAAQSLTGRLHLLTLWPLSQGEIGGAREHLLERLLSEPAEAVRVAGVSRTGREEYVARILAGGMPIPLSRGGQRARNRWFDDYATLVLERDVRELSRLRQRERLPALLRRLAAQTGQLLNVTTITGAAGLDRGTGGDYIKLLEAVFLVMRLPAWGTTLRARAANAPKLHLVDSGLAAHLLGLTQERLLRRDPPSLSQFGHLLETFVVGELLRQASWLETVRAQGHWRTYDGDEVDLIIERDDGRILAFEVKAAARVPAADMRPLLKLRDALGERLLAGVALYTGAHAYRAGEHLYVMPVDRLWDPAPKPGA